MNGVDVSSFQPNTNWQKVRNTGREFSITKATEGLHYRDKYLDYNRKGMRDNGMACGLYHFAGSSSSRTLNNPLQEADWFVNNVVELSDNEFLILDFELTYAQSPGTLIDWINQWMARVSVRTNMQPVFYTYISFLRDNLRSDQSLSRYPLWIAAYSSRQPNTPWPAIIWQYTDKASVDGVSGSCDDNKLLVDISELPTKGWHSVLSDKDKVDLQNEMDKSVIAGVHKVLDDQGVTAILAEMRAELATVTAEVAQIKNKVGA